MTVVYTYNDFPAGATESQIPASGNDGRGIKVVNTSSILYNKTPSNFECPYSASVDGTYTYTVGITNGTTNQYSKTNSYSFSGSGTFSVDISDNTHAMQAGDGIFLHINSSNVTLTRATWSSEAASYDAGNTIRHNYMSSGSETGSNETTSDMKYIIEDGASPVTSSPTLQPPPPAFVRF
jgi:hypothetical protein